jgi:membrane protease YdiL (CAAX protease family)
MTEIDGTSKFPRIRWALLWIVVFWLLQIVFAFASVKLAFPNVTGVLEFLTLAQDFKQSGPAQLYGAVASGVVTIGLLAIYLSRDGRSAAIGLNNWSKLSLPKTIGLCILLFLSSIAITFFYSKYVMPDVELQRVTRELIASIPKDLIHQILLILMVTVFAAVIEELLFRGLLQNGLKRRFGAGWAIVGAGVVFGLIHFQLAALPILAIMGMAFGYVYHVTGSLRVNIALHLVNNALALALGS